MISVTASHPVAWAHRSSSTALDRAKIERTGELLIARVAACDSTQAVFTALFSVLREALGFDRGAAVALPSVQLVSSYCMERSQVDQWAAHCRRHIQRLIEEPGAPAVLTDRQSVASALLDPRPGCAGENRYSPASSSLLVLVTTKLYDPTLLLLGRVQASGDFDERDKELTAALLNHLRLAVGFANAARPDAHSRGPSPAAASELTSRESEVAQLVAAGHTNKEIAALLQTSPHTIRNQVHAVFNKLKVRTRAQLASSISNAMQTGVTPIPNAQPSGPGRR